MSSPMQADERKVPTRRKDSDDHDVSPKACRGPDLATLLKHCWQACCQWCMERRFSGYFDGTVVVWLQKLSSCA